MVYNVLATDIRNNYVSAYIPAVSYACTFEVGKPGCQMPSSLINKIISPLLGLVGLFLCLLAHRLFHVEVFVFSWVIMAVPWYMLLVGVANMSHTGEEEAICIAYIYQRGTKSEREKERDALLQTRCIN